ncbi:MAG: hypothetical protein K0Q72_4717 [Armatimonadetes bacterium]|jgi:hypothetical protein|nr:hypothetical protein [Armatimonadota bacterium]
MAETTHEFRDFALKMTRGDELQLDVTVTKTAAGLTSAQSLAEGTVWITAKRQLGDAAPVFQLNSAGLGGVAVQDAAAGTARVTVPPEATEALPDRETVLYVDLVWVDGDGMPHTFQKGKLAVYPDVTVGS